jgi:hypothetical protein
MNVDIEAAWQTHSQAGVFAACYPLHRSAEVRVGADSSGWWHVWTASWRFGDANAARETKHRTREEAAWAATAQVLHLGVL